MFFSNKKLEFDKEIIIQNKKVLIQVNFSKVKNSSVRFSNDKIIFNFPNNLSNKIVQKHYEKLLTSIRKKLEKKEINFLKDKIKDVLEKKEFYFNNILYKIEFHNFLHTKFFNNTFFINEKITNKNFLKSISYFLEKENLKFIKNYVIELNKKTYNYDIKDVKLKYLNSKWGHCTKDDIIMINLKLLNTKKEFLDYVIIHELSHIKHKNHSKKFWDNVSIYFNNYKEIHKRLKIDSPDIF